MTKTTVYLPEDVKRALTRLAATSGRSEASLIRDALDSLVRTAQPPRPRGGLWESGDASLAERAEEALSGFGER
jgi:plasmid stability protein